MFCIECGRELEHTLKFCTNCGFKISRAMLNQETNLDNQQSVDCVVNSEKNISVHNGIGGWLVIVLLHQLYATFNGIIALYNLNDVRTSEGYTILSNVNSEYFMEGIVLLSDVQFFGAIMNTVLAILTVILLLNKSKLFRSSMVCYLSLHIIMPILYIFLTISLSDNFTSSEIGIVTDNYIIALIGGGVTFFVLAIYLFSSERVKNTFGY